MSVFPSFTVSTIKCLIEDCNAFQVQSYFLRGRGASKITLCSYGYLASKSFQNYGLLLHDLLPFSLRTLVPTIIKYSVEMYKSIFLLRSHKTQHLNNCIHKINVSVQLITIPYPKIQFINHKSTLPFI